METTNITTIEEWLESYGYRVSELIVTRIRENELEETTMMR